MVAYDNFCLRKLTICPGWGARPPHRGAILIVGLSSGKDTHPSGHDTDEVRVTTSDPVKSFGFSRILDQTRVNINLICPKSMVEPMKKSESERESEKIKVLEERIKWLIEQNIRRSDEIEGLYLRLEAIEGGNNTGFKHENDGGWFD